MDDLRNTAYAYYNAFDEDTKHAIKDFSEQMETKKLPDKIRFKEFSAYMETIGFPHFSSKEFFDELRGEKDHLAYPDVMTLLYIIQSGRPFCNGNNCREFIKGMYFTCVTCFEKEGDYSFNLCPSCRDHKKYKHDHEEFLDPIVMLRLKTKQELMGQSTVNDKPSGSNTSKSSSYKAQSLTSSSNSIVLQNPQRKTAAGALQLMQLAVGFGNLVVATSSLCTIM